MKYIQIIAFLVFAFKVTNAQPAPLPHAPINESILDIDFKNSLPDKNVVPNISASDWPKNVCGNDTWLPGGTPKEWVSILDDKNSRYNSEIVGVSGIAIYPHVSTADVWFTHPFGFDYNFDVAWHSNQNFDFLKSPVVQKDEEADLIRGIVTNKGFENNIHVEIDSDFVPPYFRAREGNSVAVFGRWVVDCGHENYQTEIHPPLMFVKAVGQMAIGGGPSTEATVIGRPYLVAQDFGDGETLRNHIAKQTTELLLSQGAGPFVAAFHYHAIPNILPKPFTGTHIMVFDVRPPRQALANEHLYFSYHLTVRSGITVTFFDVNDGKGTIRVNVLFDELTYVPPQLPPAVDDNISIETIKSFNDPLNKALWVGQFGTAANPFVAIALNNGVKTQRYSIPVYNEQGDVKQTMNELRANGNAGITVDDSQPYPIRGNMKVEWVYIQPEVMNAPAKHQQPATVIPPAIHKQTSTVVPHHF